MFPHRVHYNVAHFLNWMDFCICARTLVVFFKLRLLCTNWPWPRDRQSLLQVGRKHAQCRVSRVQQTPELIGQELALCTLRQLATDLPPVGGTDEWKQSTYDAAQWLCVWVECTYIYSLLTAFYYRNRPGIWLYMSPLVLYSLRIISVYVAMNPLSLLWLSGIDGEGWNTRRSSGVSANERDLHGGTIGESVRYVIPHCGTIKKNVLLCDCWFTWL